MPTPDHLAVVSYLTCPESISMGDRVLILTGVDYEEDHYTACSLERNGKVSWSDWGPLSGLIDKAGVTTVYRRWE